MNKGMGLIVRTAARGFFPFMFMYGIYIILHGHLTPGGGFPGGVIIATSLVMLLLACGYTGGRKGLKGPTPETVESLGGLALVGIGLAGVCSGVFFLQNILPHGDPGSLFSAGNLPLLNAAVGVKVAAGFVLIFYSIIGIGEHRP